MKKLSNKKAEKIANKYKKIKIKKQQVLKYMKFIF